MRELAFSSRFPDLRRGHVVGMAILLVVFFLLRGGAWREFSHTIFYTHPLLDAYHYDQVARAVAEGRWQQDQAFFMGPGYPYALGITYAIFGPEPWVGRAFNLLCSMATLALILGLGWRIRGAVAGFAGAALWALYRPAIFYEQTLLMEVLAGTLGVATVAMAVAWFAPERDREGEGREPSSRRLLVGGLVCGLLLGLAALTRATILAFAPFLAVWVFLRVRNAGTSPEVANTQEADKSRSKGRRKLSRREKRRRGRDMIRTQRAKRIAFGVTGALVAGIVVGGLPAVIHNVRAEPGFVAITSNGGINLYIGNNPLARGYFNVPPGINTEQDPRGARLAEKTLGRKDLSSAEVSAWWSGLARTWIRDHPGRFLVNTARKAALLFTGGEIPQIYHPGAMRESLSFLRWPLATFLWLIPLAAVGFAWGLRRSFPDRPIVWLLFWYLIAFVGSLLPFFVTGRYRLPLIPVLCVVGGLGVAALWEMGRSGAWRRLAVYGGLAVLACAMSFAIEGLQSKSPEDISRFESMHAGLLLQAAQAEPTTALQTRRMEEAKSLLEQRAAVAPTPGVWSNLGMIYQAEPEGLEKAADAFENAAKLQSTDARIWFNLSQVLLQLGRRDKAREALERTLALDPDVQPLAWYNLALLRAMAGDTEGARTAVEEFLKRKPGDAQGQALLNNLTGSTTPEETGTTPAEKTTPRE